jgi:hypothetical protein
MSATRSGARRTRPVDWRQWLDIVDEVALVPAGISDLTYAEDLLVATGIARRTAMRERAAARRAFHELQAVAPAGVTPAVVRRELDGWRFDDATRDIRLARQIAQRLAAMPATSLDLPVLWATYEAAASRTALRSLREGLP